MKNNNNEIARTKGKSVGDSLASLSALVKQYNAIIDRAKNCEITLSLYPGRALPGLDSLS